ncbi:MAG: hypothetical protein KJ593_07800 [Candidatus Omnitrophica bacterium]|nr:hypothetical protein [Candidatus Omnitrophota bacterium]
MKIFILFCVLYFIIAYSLNLIVGWRVGCNRPENVYGAGYEASRKRWTKYKTIILFIAAILAIIATAIVKVMSSN